MLTPEWMKRVEFLGKGCSIFGITPPDKTLRDELTGFFPKLLWRMSYTFKFHTLLSIILPSVIAFSCVAFVLDVWINDIPLDQLLVNSFLIGGGCFNACVALGIFFYFDEFGPLIPNIFKLNREYQSEFLTAEDMKTLGEGGSMSRDVIIIMELITNSNAAACSFHIFEEYDMYRRYRVVPTCYMLGWDPDSWQIIPFMIEYWILARLLYGYLYFLVLWLALYLETTTFWVEQLINNPRINFQDMVRVYRVQQAVHRCMANSKFIQVLLPTCFYSSFAMLVMSLVCIVKFYGSLGTPILMVLITSFLVVSFIVNMWFVQVGRLNDMSKDFIGFWEEKGGQDKSCSTYVQSFGPLNMRIGNFFDVDSGTLLGFYNEVVDKTITAILA